MKTIKEYIEQPSQEQIDEMAIERSKFKDKVIGKIDPIIQHVGLVLISTKYQRGTALVGHWKDEIKAFVNEITTKWQTKFDRKIAIIQVLNDESIDEIYIFDVLMKKVKSEDSFKGISEPDIEDEIVPNIKEFLYDILPTLDTTNKISKYVDNLEYNLGII